MLVSTGLGRHPREVHICPACLKLSEHEKGKRTERCPHCEQRFDDGLVAPRTLHACACGDTYEIPPQGSIETPCQRLVAVDYRCERCHEPYQRAFKDADAADHARLRRAGTACPAAAAGRYPRRAHPRGAETERLLKWGYQPWSDLFGPRQLYGLGVLAQVIGREGDPAQRAALQTVFSDLLRYQNALVRYDRQALKPTDVFAVHGFPVPRVSCEAALLGQPGRGSGGFRHALSKYVRAKRWCASLTRRSPTGAAGYGEFRPHPKRSPRRCATRSISSASAGGRCSSARQLMRGDLPENSVEMVLTDPPYFANVQYAELMQFCYAWLRRLAPGAPFFDVAHAKTDEDAVGSLGIVGLSDFAARLSEVYCAAALALKPGGPFAFTYHHNQLDAYAPLVVACLDAGLVPTRLFACPSEMRASTHIHGRNAATVDAVFVLRKPPVPASALGADLLDVERMVSNRLQALRRAGVKPTAADRACLRHAAAAARAMVTLAAGWDRDAPAPERAAAAVVALSAAAPSAV